MDDFRFDRPTHTYWFGSRRVSGINEALESVGLKPPINIVSRRHRANFEYAGERGTAVHKMCELEDLGESGNYTFDPNLVGYLEAWKVFKLDYGYSPDVTEQPIGHPVYQFGGTPDSGGTCEKMGGYFAVERKQRKLLPQDKFQVALQVILLRDVLGKPCKGGVLVELRKDGKYCAEEVRTRPLERLVLAAIAVSNYKISNP